MSTKPPRKWYAKIGRKGGQNCQAAKTPEERIAFGHVGAEARWGKKKAEAETPPKAKQ